MITNASSCRYNTSSWSSSLEDITVVLPLGLCCFRALFAKYTSSYLAFRVYAFWLDMDALHPEKTSHYYHLSNGCPISTASQGRLVPVAPWKRPIPAASWGCSIPVASWGHPISVVLVVSSLMPLYGTTASPVTTPPGILWVLTVQPPFVPTHWFSPF